MDTLTPGIYYMYATLSETDNYKAYTTPTTSFRVGSRPTSIQNGSFETPAIGSWYSIMSETTPSIAWETTASDGKIEFARPSKNMSAEKHIALAIADSAMETLTEQALNNLQNGGRGIGNVVENLLINPLSRYLFDNEIFDNASVTLDKIDTTATPPSLECTKG